MVRSRRSREKLTSQRMARVVARVARILADDEVNIAYLTVSRKKRGGEAMMSIEVDRPLSEVPLRYLEHLSYILWVRQIPPVMG